MGNEGVISVTSLSFPYTPKTRHSLKKLAICFIGKFTTAKICWPTSYSFLYRDVICADDFLIPSVPKSISSLYEDFLASGKSPAEIIVPLRISSFSKSCQVISGFRFILFFHGYDIIVNQLVLLIIQFCLWCHSVHNSNPILSGMRSRTRQIMASAA